MSRAKRHGVFLITNLVLLGLGAMLLSYASVWERISVASAWLCMLLLCMALLIGPQRRLAGRPAPLNIYLRRDLGFWAGLQALLHFYAGTVVSMNQTYLQAFVHVDTSVLALETRDQLFFWGSTVGFIVAVLFLVLLLISSDKAMHMLGPERWKKIQKSAHLVLWLTVLHGFAFQLLEARYIPLLLLAMLTMAVFYMQIRGRRKSV